MKKQIFYLVLLSYFLLTGNFYAQNSESSDISEKVTKLFRSEEILPIKLSYTNKDVERNTNDSTYIKTDLSYQEDDGTWKTLEVEIRARGNFRRKNCYFPPIKLKIKKSAAKETVFKGNKKLKLVVPCLKAKNVSDNVLKEFIAYKLYENISPYHFKTRLVRINLTEDRGKKTIEHDLYGILLEDDKNLEKRLNCNEMKRFIHPLAQDGLSSVQNAFFQFMIANTDFSTAYQHNEKLFFIDEKMVPVPYDFDMSGLVDASYAVVSQIAKEELPITDVKQRMYRGFKRDPQIYKEIRQQYLDKKGDMLAVFDKYESIFYDDREFRMAKQFILDFYEVIENENSYNDKIFSQARTK
jgi:hypothetical protein